jgi:hypothetical protein
LCPGVVVPCSLVGAYQQPGGTCYLHHEGWSELSYNVDGLLRVGWRLGQQAEEDWLIRPGEWMWDGGQSRPVSAVKRKAALIRAETQEEEVQVLSLKRTFFHYFRVWIRGFNDKLRENSVVQHPSVYSSDTWCLFTHHFLHTLPKCLSAR